MKKTVLAHAISLGYACSLAGFTHIAFADDSVTTLQPVVVTAPASSSPLEVVLDPKAAQQPIPANDGASYLKNIPGFSVVRKGGTDGDPILRGSAGSRLNILLDGMEFHGGCGGRMDPPTAYVFPESFDVVTVIKGPQTVRYGNGNSAGVVLFGHDEQEKPSGISGVASVMTGSWGRADGAASVSAVSDKAALTVTLTHAQSDNYQDGEGQTVHSAYQRQSATVLGSVALTEQTQLKVDLVGSRGEAAYADRSVDGSKFDRESYGLTLSHALKPNGAQASMRVYHSYVDHIIDNYSLRAVTATDKYSTMNVDRATDGLRLALSDIKWGNTTALVGADWRDDTHTYRGAMPMGMMTVTLAQANAALAGTRHRDFASRFTGVYTELATALNDSQVIKYGARIDQWQASRYNSSNGNLYGRASDTLSSGFVRLEQTLPDSGMRAHIGFGRSERPMDFWEATTYNGITTTGLTKLQPEVVDQIDAGLMWTSGRSSASASVFYAKVANHMLTYSGAVNQTATMSCAGMMGAYSCSGNVDASKHGFELEGRRGLSANLSGFASMSYVRANNDTMGGPLAQTPPLEVKVGADWSHQAWTAGVVVRAVSSQDRYSAGFGSVVGVDRNVATPGFATLGVNGSYKPNRSTVLSFGIDNLFNRNYFEHISRTDVSIAGYSSNANSGVNEPGRTLWLKGQVTF